MRTPKFLCLLPLLVAIAGPVCAASLDFPDATFRIQIGTQATKSPANAAGREILIDGKPALAGERLNCLMRVNWIVAPIPGVGDEHVIIVRRPDEKPRTYSGVFKGGYLKLVDEQKLLVEIEE